MPHSSRRPDIKRWYTNQPITIKGTIIGGFFAIVAAIIGGLCSIAAAIPPIVANLSSSSTATIANSVTDIHLLAFTPTVFVGTSAPYAKSIEYINLLPELKSAEYKKASIGWNTGVTSKVVTASYEYIDFLKGVLVSLGSYYPDGHFGQGKLEDYFESIVTERFDFYRKQWEPDGPGTGGTMVSVAVSSSVINDLDEMIVSMVNSIILYSDEDFNLSQWNDRWRLAEQLPTATP